MKRWHVDVSEYELGFGSKILFTKDFDSREQALDFIKKENEKNNKDEIPDYYIAAGQPYLKHKQEKVTMTNHSTNEPTFDTVRRNVFEEEFSFLRIKEGMIYHLDFDQSSGGYPFWHNHAKPQFSGQNRADETELNLLMKIDTLYSPGYDYYIVDWAEGTTRKLDVGNADAIKALQRKIVLKKLSDEDRKILGV